jgi:hypothetical protein
MDDVVELYLDYGNGRKPFMFKEGMKHSVPSVSITAWKEYGGVPREMEVGKGRLWPLGFVIMEEVLGRRIC